VVQARSRHWAKQRRPNLTTQGAGGPDPVDLRAVDHMVGVDVGRASISFLESPDGCHAPLLLAARPAGGCRLVPSDRPRGRLVGLGISYQLDGHLIGQLGKARRGKGARFGRRAVSGLPSAPRGSAAAGSARPPAAGLLRRARRGAPCACLDRPRHRLTRREHRRRVRCLTSGAARGAAAASGRRLPGSLLALQRAQVPVAAGEPGDRLAGAGRSRTRPASAQPMVVPPSKSFGMAESFFSAPNSSVALFLFHSPKSPTFVR
jgi:hypothetical protein